MSYIFCVPRWPGGGPAVLVPKCGLETQDTNPRRNPNVHRRVEDRKLRDKVMVMRGVELAIGVRALGISVNLD